MKKYKIFVSAVQKELKDERRSIKNNMLDNSLLNEYFSVFLFEDSPAKSKSAKSFFIEEVQKSDIYIGILGNEYGTVNRDNLSATGQEFREAQEKDKEIFIYIKGKNDNKRDKRIQKIIKEVKSSETGYSYKRFNNNSELQNSVHESLVEFLREKGIVGREAFDKNTCEGAPFREIDSDKIKWLLDIAKSKRNYPIDINVPVREALIYLNLITDGSLTNSAILLFGKNPQKLHIQSEIKCLQLPGTEVEKPFSSYHIYKGNLFEQIDKAFAFVLDCIRMPVIQQKNSARVSRPYEVPEFAIQEAIVNAIAHRDYNNNGAVQVMVFVDRIEIWNPGRLPSQLTIDLLRKPHTSYPNNPLIAEILYLADYIQKAGSGTLEMIKQCRKNGLPEPEFLNAHGEFRTIIARDIFTESTLNKLGLNERQLKAVKYVKEKGSITLSLFSNLCADLSEKTLYRDLQYLVTKGILKQFGEKKGRRYILK